jgi:amidase
MKNFTFTSATELVRQIKSEEVSCEFVLTQFLNQIKIFNPSINAISDLRGYDELLLEAIQKDKEIRDLKPLGPLHGLPITVKDTYDVKKLISSNGNPQLKNNVPKNDAELVKRLKDAGAIIIGKSNLALFALDWQSSNKWFGQTNNPYNLRHVVGGSSGGSAASLAAGFSSLELGTDAGGSIRVPAHFCGVCGLRTTESALPSRGNMQSPKALRIGRYLTCNGPMARNMDDLMLMLSVLSNSNQQFSENPPVNLKQFSWTKESKLNIAFSQTLDGVVLDNEYKELYLAFIEKVRQLKKVELVDIAPDYDSNKLIQLWGKIAGFDFGVALKRIPFKSLISSLFIRSKYKDGQWAKAMGSGAGISPRKYAEALEEKDNVSDTFTSFFNRYDIWITPVSADKAFKHQKPGVPLKINGKKIPYTKAFIPFNFPSTIPGHPILVIPIGITKSGLPVGIQIHAQKWHDNKLLQIGKELEKLTDGFQIPTMFN